jgi:predicted CXXCH cytochrome family protein
MTRRTLLLVVGTWWTLLAVVVSGQIDMQSPANKHNLSVSGPGPVKAQTETEICIFCHTPHNANPAVPLWNHTMSAGVTYLPYTSTTLNAAVGVPTGSSKLCLSCHDGTVAIGSTMIAGPITMNGVGGSGQLTGTSVIGPDLRNDHPVSFVPSLATDIVAPPANSPVKLDASGQVQCRSCHDPHRMDIDTTAKKFLVVNNSASGLCIVCHNTPYWATNPSTHKTSTKSFTAAQGAHTGYSTVATNGCEGCHKPHAAPAAQRNLNGLEEGACTSCHGPAAIGRNIAAEFTKAYRHPTYSVTPSVHDALESPSSPTSTLPETGAATARHAECADCHNAHASYAATATAPKGSGKLAGVWGIDSNGAFKLPSGTPASVNEYEICYKCHADSANKPQPVGPTPPYPNRVALQFNKRLQFDPANLSYHPIEAAGKNLTVPSLIPPWTVNSIVTCTDCHDNDTGPNAPTPGTGPSGPHGSQYQQLMVARYDRDTSNTTESAAAYALCYKCHDRTRVRNNPGQFSDHGKHITEYQASCSICHDPHGVANSTHLVNFDKRFVTPNGGALTWTPGNNGCTLTCHGATHPR